ncbi:MULTISPECIES: acyl-CoA dehydrogenase family protein [Streptomyces]|uniref:Pimeloyl-CoA dehydrogenase, small subunit n=1 Tax=Streptomyces sviceus (strain ATCC 29083 / DSM 924 / JCM 4929 / NBRC 13980 / NCIMB 11184 / NRRL 5439 / UC 5370) TaxID=463191 RepID=D6XCT9_STRX2|nr:MULTISPECIES: acyl-CoA dehydrogenase family protein [Streptomyces]EFH29096.1 pimeloyl-CoA dehydrogenase, small subunit [Streptomyces sviceus ATCC 29083]MYT10529.1 acyl-CoA dehydrogenase [Streptomyces sp. SID5470]
MDLTFSEEQDELRKVVRSFLAKHSDEATVRRLAADAQGHDPVVWRRMAGELGLQGLAVPEEYGGSGFGYVDLGIVFEEAGRALLGGPYFATVALAVEALLRCSDEQARHDFLPGIVSGETVATLALTEDSGHWDEQGIGLTAVRDETGAWQLTGVKAYVPDGHLADLLLVAARTPSGISLLAVETADAPGLTRTPLPTLDQTRKQARIEFADTPARLLGPEGTAWPALERTLATAAVLLAAEQVGGAAAALDAAVAYAKIREQYGRPIGSFQGIKHKCADMLMEIESARSAAYGGLWALDEGDGTEITIAAALAQAFCSEAFTKVAADNIQVHGGIGFTWEHPAHLYFKRAKSSEVLLGTPSYHRELLATRLGI